MKNNIWLLAILSSIIIAICQFYVPWWSIPFLLFIAGLALFNNAGKSFAFGIMTGAVVWIGTAFYQDYGSHVSAAETIANLLGGMPDLLVFIITGLVGGIVYGLSSISGTFLRKLIFK